LLFQYFIRFLARFPLLPKRFHFCCEHSSFFTLILCQSISVYPKSFCLLSSLCLFLSLIPTLPVYLFLCLPGSLLSLSLSLSLSVSLDLSCLFLSSLSLSLYFCPSLALSVSFLLSLSLSLSFSLTRTPVSSLIHGMCLITSCLTQFSESSNLK
jgi:hypothetical protein